MSEFDRWESRFSAPEYIFGTGPNHFLAACKPLLPASGRALAVADGEGRNGVWLAEQGLDVVSIDFSPRAQEKARNLAGQRGVRMSVEQADVHDWSYPPDSFDVVAEIFTQFSDPGQRRRKWDGMKRTLKSGGLIIIEGYSPRQLEFGTGGPKQLDHLYTREMLEAEFAGWRDISINEQEMEMHEGPAHTGMSAVISLTARKP